MCGSVLLFKSLLRLQQVDIGVRVDHVITMSVDLARERYPTGNHTAAFSRLVVERLQAIPGIESASVSSDVPLEGTGGENLRMPGRDDRLLVRFKRVDPGYFTTMGVPIVAGRRFTVDDRAGAAHVVMINEALASRLKEKFGIADPLGQAVDLPALGFGPNRRATVVRGLLARPVCLHRRRCRDGRRGPPRCGDSGEPSHPRRSDNSLTGRWVKWPNDRALRSHRDTETQDVSAPQAGVTIRHQPPDHLTRRTIASQSSAGSLGGDALRREAGARRASLMGAARVQRGCSRRQWCRAPAA